MKTSPLKITSGVVEFYRSELPLGEAISAALHVNESRLWTAFDAALFTALHTA